MFCFGCGENDDSEENNISTNAVKCPNCRTSHSLSYHMESDEDGRWPRGYDPIINCKCGVRLKAQIDYHQIAKERLGMFGEDAYELRLVSLFPWDEETQLIYEHPETAQSIYLKSISQALYDFAKRKPA